MQPGPNIDIHPESFTRCSAPIPDSDVLSIVEGHLHISQQHASVTPLLMKPSLNRDELKNHLPVLYLTFISEVVERLVSAGVTAQST